MHVVLLLLIGSFFEIHHSLRLFAWLFADNVRWSIKYSYRPMLRLLKENRPFVKHHELIIPSLDHFFSFSNLIISLASAISASEGIGTIIKYNTSSCMIFLTEPIIPPFPRPLCAALSRGCVRRLEPRLE